ncbi:cytosol aminopeptidase [Nematocida sp. LUAm3]|nr:cytosol aminopeptidase [Nematocida sp. LUAm3]KAI5176105.1 cytosol aminopeptidase [Nematocida sp. LUAm2]KAI5178993.1 cytosol aminopeptidase [Nematocida sp. LUAm1]
MDWKRICLRTQNKEPQEIIGEVLIYQKDNIPEEHKDLFKRVPNTQGNTKILYAHNKVYAACALTKKEIDSPSSVRSYAAKAAKLLMREGLKHIAIRDAEHGKWIAEGIVLSTYQNDSLQKKGTQISLIYNGTNKEVSQAIAVTEAQNFVRFLVESPANLMTPSLFCQYAKEFLPEAVEVKIHNKTEIEAMNMHLFLGVAQGSIQEPKLLEISYKNEGSPISLVGKGITFDSGGISLKPPQKMSYMKGDMGGAAAVIGVIGALAKLNANTSVIGIIPLTENLPSGSATKPGDVHVGRAGISVEVDNTDAEGRLVLADALHYAQSFSPKYIVDIATLTGAINVALGPIRMGLFSNSEELVEQLERASERAKDLLWRLPVGEEYSSLIKSEIADLKNMSINPGAGSGSIVAAMFLKEFVGDTPWAHLDIAAVSFNTLHPELYGKGATGRPVQLLAEWLLSAK